MKAILDEGDFADLLELMPLCLHEQAAMEDVINQLEVLRKARYTPTSPVMYLMMMDINDVIGKIPRQIELLGRAAQVQEFVAKMGGIFVFGTANLTEVLSRGTAAPKTMVQACFCADGDEIVVLNASHCSSGSAAPVGGGGGGGR